MWHCSPVTETTQEGGKGQGSTQTYRADKNVQKTCRSTLGLSKTVFSMWIWLFDELRGLAWRNRGGSQYQLISPWKHLPPEMVLAQLITAGSATPLISPPSSPAEEMPWAQVCNSILELRTDFLIPLVAEKGKVWNKECPGPPSRHWGHPGRAPEQPGSLSRDPSIPSVAAAALLYVCSEPLAESSITRGWVLWGCPTPWPGDRTILVFVLKKTIATSCFCDIELMRTKLCIVCLHLGFFWLWISCTVWKSWSAVFEGSCGKPWPEHTLVHSLCQIFEWL